MLSCSLGISSFKERICEVKIPELPAVIVENKAP